MTAPWTTAMNLQPLRDHLQAILPVCGPRFQLASLHGAIQGHSDPHEGLFESRSGDLCLDLLFICFDEPNEDGVQLIEDAKSQECVLVFADHVDHPHLKAYLDGWAQALLHIFAHGDPKHLQKLTPQELIFPGVLNLRAPRTAEEFTQALLGSRHRLGHALPLVTLGLPWPPLGP